MRNIYLGGYGAGNLGDDLILTSILSESSDSTIVSYGRPLIDQVQPYLYFSEFLENAHNILSEHDALIFGGGGLFWSHDHIYEMLVLALIAKGLGIRVELRRIGLHGFHVNLQASKHLLRIADFVSFREHDSLDLARRVLGHSNAVVEEDYAQRLLTPVNRVQKDKLQIGVNIGTTRFTHDPAFANHVSMIYGEIARRYQDRADFVYIPFCIHMSEEDQNDLSRADALFAASEGRIRYCSGVGSVGKLIETCSNTDIFIGERFHMHVIAHGLGRPMIPFIHNEQTKYHALAQEYGDAPVFYEMSQAMIIDQIAERLERLIGKMHN